MKDLSVTKLIHEHRENIKAQLSDLKKSRAALPAAYKKPCIYLASVVKGPRSKANPAGTREVKVVVFNVHGGHKKPATVRNMMRNGQFPVGHDLPDTDSIYREVSALQNAEGTLVGDAAKLGATGQDPYAELRNFLDAQIHNLFSHWELGDIKQEYTSLQKRALDAEQAAEKAKQELEDLKKAQPLQTVPKVTKNKEEKIDE